MVTLGSSSTAACVHELFEQQAARTPDAVALIFNERSLTYRQLNESANLVAHYLRRRRVGPDALVGVALERSPEMVIALLGVLKSGGAYVPLDPHYPMERLAFMVRDAGLWLLLTDRQSRPLFEASSVNVVCLDDDWPTITLESTENPRLTTTPNNLAYVMYTSGSSGQPKGAMILHGGLANYLCWAIDAYGFVAGGSAPLHSSISFDLTVTSLYPPLLVGGRVELLAEDTGAQNLLAALRRATPHTVVKITPAHLDLLSQQITPAEMARMHGSFVIGGENLLAESLRPWRQHAPAVRLFNEYGPTETVVGCCVHEVRAEDAGSGAVPIGRPIANTRLYVLNEEMQPLPPGVGGELYIGGAGVARGYLNRAQLTQDRFLADRFSSQPGACLYKTGDLARYRADGVLEYLGRIDGQVKVDGYRIEPGEIEAHLAAHGKVQACVVLAPETAPGNRQLLACVVARGDASPTGRSLKSFLRQRLPAFMVPVKYIFRAALPLTVNGKVDRQALLDEITAGKAMAAPLSFEPRTPVEEKIAAIWCELLVLDELDIDDDVFDLGARSLQAVRAVMLIRQAFDVDLQLHHVFSHPTVAGLAAVIDGLLWLTRVQAPSHDIRPLEEIAL